MPRSVATAALACLCVASIASAQPGPRPGTDPTRRLLMAVRITDAPPIIDGRLDDAIWQHADVAADFVQLRPNPTQPATHRTEARLAYDDAAIYVAMRMHDPAPDSIAAQLARRDATGIFSDWADVLIDSYNDRRTAYRFSVNPAGVKKDVYHYNDHQEDLGWDAVWDVATRIDEHGWTAEFRIPLSQLRYAPSDSPDDARLWGVQFSRTIARYDEMSFWAPVPPNAPGFVSFAGELAGLRGLGSPKRLEVLPYAVSKVTRAPELATGNPFYRANAPAAALGADLKYGVTSNLTLTGTINPDFGQVEADPSVVNLSAFESFFPERRPFFLEGANLFTMQIGDDGTGEGLFYSRRIGRAPQRGSFPGTDHVDVPEAARILAAAKVTGRTPGGWSIGFFDAVTEGVHARVARAGELGEMPAEPLTNYAVGRVARDFRGGQSNIGGMFTATNRRIDDAALDFLRSSAYAGGIDWRHRFGGGNFQVDGYVAASSIFGDTLALQLAQRSPARYFQRPDAGHVEFDPTRTSLHGMAGRFSVGRIGGGRTNGGVGGAFRTPGFEVNDAGFQTNGDQRFAFGWMNYNQFQPGRHFQRWNVGINPNAGWNFDGTRLWSQINSWGSATLNNFWNVNFWFNHSFAGTSVGALRGGPALYRSGANRGNFNISSDRRKPVFFNVGSWASRDHDGQAWQWNGWGSVTVRPSAQFDVMLNPWFNVNRHGWQYVATPTARAADGSSTGRPEYLFAALRQNTVAMTTRVNYTFTPTLSLQLYAQPFISAGAFDSFRRVAAPGARAFTERFVTFDGAAITRTEQQYRAQLDNGEHITFGNPDFNVRQLRSNAVLRWEYRPGSTLFLVWSQSRNGFDRVGDFSFGRDVDQLLATPATNVLLIKMNYWLDF
jgi:hypothetical protein